MTDSLILFVLAVAFATLNPLTAIVWLAIFGAIAKGVLRLEGGEQ